MNGQLSIFDIHNEKKRPCDYSFQRYIGQEVELGCGVTGKITEIEPYYTIILARDIDGVMREFAGTPTTCWPKRETDA